MDDIVNDFLIESHEGLDQLDRDLIALEHTPTDRDLLSRIFRCVHTIKGTCGFLAFAKLEAVTHVGENLLVRLRDGDLKVTPALTSALLTLVDAIREMLASIESTGGEGEGDYAPLIATLTALHDGDVSAAEPPSPKKARKSRRKHHCEPDAPVGELLVAAGATESADVLSALQEQHAGSALRVGEILIERAAAPADAVAEVLEGQGEARSALTESTIRVDVSLLDQLMNQVGELVLARNQILQHASTQRDPALTAAAQRLDLLTTGLQERVMKTRMQPIGNVWSKFPRIIRDLATICGKQIRLDMEGADTELDKTLIEAIKDPLTHIVRNSADHGIESPERRVAAGKPAEGTVTLRAFHEGGQVLVEIRDDGAGIDAHRIAKKAVEKGLISAEHAARMSAREALNLIFLAGLSTAEQVTNISGRGVGMDVVRSNIERIGGTVEIQSTLGEGSCLKIRIPLTLAIVPALIVTSDGNRYAIPQANLVELIRRERPDATRAIEHIHGAPVHRLRGLLLPLVYLHDVLRAPRVGEANDAALNIVVLQADDRTFGLVVDDINDTEEIVVKPLGKQLKRLTEFAGATIMGDGRVALILDVTGTARSAHVITGHRDRSRVDHESSLSAVARPRDRLLVCAIGDSRRVAIPLSSVDRLEEFAVTQCEQAGHYDVVQYYGEILPLLNLPSLLGLHEFAECAEHGMLRAVVYTRHGRRVGLVVGQILDILEEDITVDVSTARDGVTGSTIIQQRVTDVLNIEAIVDQAAPWLADMVPVERAA